MELDRIGPPFAPDIADILIHLYCGPCFPPRFENRHHCTEGTSEGTAHAGVVGQGARTQIGLPEVSLHRIEAVKFVIRHRRQPGLIDQLLFWWLYGLPFPAEYQTSDIIISLTILQRLDQRRKGMIAGTIDDEIHQTRLEHHPILIAREISSPNHDRPGELLPDAPGIWNG